MLRLVLISVLSLSLSISCSSKPTVEADDDALDQDDSAQRDGGGDSDDAHESPDGGVGGTGPLVPSDDLFGPDEPKEPCKPKTCKELDADCGAVSNGCGGIVECGKCDADARCGIVEANVCTPLADLCSPIPEADACEDRECGQVGDGCGGSYKCGDCEDGQACGVVERFVCDSVFGGIGDASAGAQCRPQTAEAACDGKQCGTVFDGCGVGDAHSFDCAEVNGGCAEDEFCGLLAPFQCDPLPTTECVPAAGCEELGWQCGTAIDECGNLHDCSTEGLSCNPATETCVGGVTGPTQCVSGAPGGGGDNCDVCDSIPTCATGEFTRLQGRVITPGKADDDTANQVGVPNAFVYILKNNDGGQLPDIASGIPEGSTSCDRCDEQDLGPVLASDTTDSLGQYTLEGNIPVGEEFLLVVKIGKFRRAEAMTLPDEAACVDTSVAPIKTRLPRTSTDGIGAHIPQIAVSTGQIDAMECVFYKMGVDESEFSEPGASGTEPARVHMYRGNGARMASGSTSHTEMHSTLSRLFAYDMVVFDCEGPGFGDYDTSDENVRHYVNSGGRMFASHLSYTWIFDNGTVPYDAATWIDTGLAPSANFTGTAGGGPANGVGIVSVGRPRANPAKIQSFSQWLVNENVATYDANADEYRFDILDPRDLSSSVNEFSEEFVYRDVSGTPWVQQYSFNTPYGAPDDAICGRVAYSGFHVSSGGSASAFANAVFPNHCSGDLTNQEKVLLYMLFDLGSCVTTEQEPPQCEPVADCTGRCGAIPDGCGGTVDCTCPEGEICLSGGVCGSTTCQPSSCEQQDAECGSVADGCGGLLDCGPCPPGEICGLEKANQCAKPPTCPPLDCDDQDAECGVIGDGCGGQVDCGPCPAGQVCGLKKAYKCDPPDCSPLTCDDENAECGLIGDGCGDLVDCGECPSGFICGLLAPNECAPVPDDAH